MAEDAISALARSVHSKAEIPLTTLVEHLGTRSSRFKLQKSKQYPSNWLMMDAKTNDPVLGTHAFVVLYANPIRTGNFVPEDETVPDGLPDSMARSDQPRAQLSVTFDLRADKTFPDNLKDLEAWGTSQKFNPKGRPRAAWQNVGSVKENMKYTVTSRLFQKKTPLNSKENEASTDAHPWIVRATAPHDPRWILNPNLVQFLHVNSDSNLVLLQDSDCPEFRPGDLVKMTFRVVFYIDQSTWSMSLSPVQIIRTGEVDAAVFGPDVHLEDHRRLQLPKAGQAFRALEASSVFEGEDECSDKEVPLSWPPSPAASGSAHQASTQGVGDEDANEDRTTVRTPKDVDILPAGASKGTSTAVKRKAEEDGDKKKKMTKRAK